MMMGLHMTCSWRKADSLLMKDSGKATMGDDAFVIEKHLSAGVQVPESRLGFQKQLRVLPVGNPEYHTGREVVEKGFHVLSRLPAGEYQADSEPRSFHCKAQDGVLDRAP